jgi:hypothetical protein
MAITNHERVGKALDLLKAGLAPFVEREFKNLYAGRALAEARRMQGDDRLLANKKLAEWDATALLKLMWEAWNDVFRRTLGQAERSLVSELRDVRNKWAHQEPFSSDDADRALDSAERLLAAVRPWPTPSFIWPLRNMCISSIPAMVCCAASQDLNPNIGRVTRFTPR